MRLFFDEDVGSGLARRFAGEVPEAEIDYVARGRQIEPGTDDLTWMKFAAANNFVVISRNRRQLRVEAERGVIREQGLGIVYLPGNLRQEDYLALLVRKKEWLERLHRGRPRPFVVYLSATGRPYPKN